MGSNVDFSIEKTGVGGVSIALAGSVPGIYLVRVIDPVSGALKAAEPLIIISE